jgi:hypothetical protein
MAKIEIKGTPEKLERIAIFLKANNIDHSIIDDYGNHSKEDLEKYRELMTKYNTRVS